MPVMRLGSRGSDVARVQSALNDRMLAPNNTITRPPMARLAEDGIFGAKTRAMVTEFQRVNKVGADGIVGPITLYLLFPFIVFDAVMAGQGPLRGTARNPVALRPGPARPLMLAQMARRLPLLATPRLLAVGEAADGDGEPDGVGVEATVSPGFKREFRPWFVLKEEEAEEPKSFSTITASATILRKAGFEVGGEFEFSRAFARNEGTRWVWEGTVSGAYSPVDLSLGPVSAKLGPVVEAKVREGLKFGAAASGEGEVSVELIKDRLELSVGGKIGAQWDVNEGSVQVGSEVSTGLTLKWEIVRFPRKQ